MADSRLPKESDSGSQEESLHDFNRKWCQDLLNDPSYRHIKPYVRRYGGPHGATYANLMGKTLFTDNTIRAMKMLYRPANSDQAPNSTGATSKEGKTIGGEVVALFSLGDEMCSHPNVLHGGINTVIVDEIGGRLGFEEVPDSSHLMAVNFNVNLRKAVKTPGIILVRAWIDRPPEGRKVWIRCRTEQDGEACIESESLYLKVKAGGGKL